MNDIELLEKAIDFAKEKHAGQIRKGSDIPYINHIKDVVRILEGENATVTTMIVGLLHDTLEDTKTTITELTQEFGVNIACMVDILTEKKELSYNERKHLQVLRIKDANKEVKLVKCADCLSNMTDIYNELQTNPNVWKKFNGSKDDIQKHYNEMLSALSELKERTCYIKLTEVYYKLFHSQHAVRYCTSCDFMDRILTPDPDDWFCDDDQMYVCKKSNKVLSRYNRPYEKQIAPTDCPLNTK